jgi:type II restriction enzyme
MRRTLPSGPLQYSPTRAAPFVNKIRRSAYCGDGRHFYRKESAERLVAQHARCPGCKRSVKTFKILPRNFKCADLICDFCGYLAQVKSKRVKGPLPDRCPDSIPGAAWGPQCERMDAGVYFSLYVVLVNDSGRAAIYFLPRDLQTRVMFVKRRPLKPTARRKGWQGFTIRMDTALSRAVRLRDGDVVEFGFQTT